MRYVLFNWFAKLTGWPGALLLFRAKVFYEDKETKNAYLKGPAVIVCNHTSIFDYVQLMFVFFRRTVRFQTAEVLYEKKGLARLLKMLGAVYVDRDAKDFGFVPKSEEILDRGGVLGIFPESRLPLKDEERPLEFKPSAAYIALAMNVPVIPVYTDGRYFKVFKRPHVTVGKPIDLFDYYDPDVSERENLAVCSEKLREAVIRLGEATEEKLCS
ncbi:MAG: 1-acyl-sn-glycerol-3-phosphate acyltransferase [Clostridia bacterium]|nr:1-acyl-sn-glycerol-3-phosphate acyltransferase [Clostridia bacterium]